MSYHEKTHTRKSRKPNEDGQSFSSSLLELICRSIDSPQDSKPKPKPSHLHRPKPTSVEDGLQTRASARACSAEKPVPNLFLDVEFPTWSRPKPIRTWASTTKEYGPTASANESKSKAMMRLYAGLKKARQPVSPGGRLTGFITSLFADSKKSKDDDRPASSYSRTCMGTYSSGSMERGKYGKKPALKGNESKGIKGKMLDDFATIVEGDEDEVEDDYDGTSDSSSDLFELNHLGMFENKSRVLCEELPVYETTYILRG